MGQFAVGVSGLGGGGFTAPVQRAMYQSALQTAQRGLGVAAKVGGRSPTVRAVLVRAGMAVERRLYTLETPAAAEAQALALFLSRQRPDAAGLLQNLTDEVNAALAADLSSARGFLSPPEYRAGQRYSGIATMQYGHALERMVGERIVSNPSLDALFTPRGIGGRGPDIVGKGAFRGLQFDITTTNPRTIMEHLGRPYGKEIMIITYERPSDFLLLP